MSDNNPGGVDMVTIHCEGNEEDKNEQAESSACLDKKEDATKVKDDDFKKKAKKDFETLQAQLKPEETCELFLKDPSAWLSSNYKLPNKFAKDSHYLDYVTGGP